MPQAGDLAECAACRLYSIVGSHGSLIAQDGSVLCWCGSYDVERVKP